MIQPIQQWQQLWRRLGSKGDSTPIYLQLEEIYSRPGLFYHNFQHILTCLAEFNSVRELFNQPDLAEVAIWYHDCIYDPKRTDNEEDSADFACASMHSLLENNSQELQDSVRRLILVTKHNQSPVTMDEALIQDIDLSILGKPPAIYNEYEKAIRQEYAWVPAEVFIAKRVEVLKKLSTPKVFHTDIFAQKYEQQAQCNIANAISVLQRNAL